MDGAACRVAIMTILNDGWPRYLKGLFYKLSRHFKVKKRMTELN